MVTNVPAEVGYATAAWMIWSPETFLDASQCPVPPRLLGSSRYALPSLPSAIASFDGVAPGTSNNTGPEPPMSESP